MKRELLKYICCPSCDGDLTLSVFIERNSEILDGTFICKECKKKWFIIDGIPRFVNIDYIENQEFYLHFLKKYKAKLEDIGCIVNNDDIKDVRLEKLKGKTSNYFGFEWDYFEDWGWIEAEEDTDDDKDFDFRGGLIPNTESAFRKKCMFGNGDLSEGNLVLDAGCGNGRYTNQAAKFGAEIIGVDIGYGVQSAYKHLKNVQNVHIIQGDLFALPFKKNIFNFVFSNGVLMHTGDARNAFCSISNHVKEGGVFVAHLYHKRNFIFEIINGTLRFFTTRLSIENNLKFARFMANWGKKLMKKGKWQIYFKYIEVLPTLHHMYDWYSAPVATHHTYPEVRKWYEDNGFEVIQSNEPAKITLMNKPESLTLKGRKIKACVGS